MLICRKILDGMEYLALMGLEHGSIKCTNILIGTMGSIRIGWFQSSIASCSDIK